MHSEVSWPPGIPARGPGESPAKGPGIEGSEQQEESQGVGEVMNFEAEDETVQVTIDSGAVDTVGPKKVGAGFPIVPTKESVRGIGYRAANGTHIKNHGERTIEGTTKEGQNLKMKITVADVSKVLASVSRICECGNRVVFDDDGSYIEEKASGEKMRLKEDANGMFILKLWVKKSQTF